jgi:hypothetical protein
LFETAVTEHFLHMVDRSAGFEQTTATFVSQIMEMQVDSLQRRQRGRQEARATRSAAHEIKPGWQRID